ncbi:TetR/AcrR family transcriptional regulator [Nonomuraea sp. FMUSA5-5]|uniref:TetR/AcrR family transcriptional regulator n=1 Tax=Nonomuraea composti TaxID=2720023 RepID=A0ABX1B139_9ACTN|nr:TetR/AcrR family transcriptional regulator [Nonomuraea sp. FMUSA5-5]NJP89506.1 TetR/AcrR family transcriptional regulator [Nonomuraea sp. FMUSA5-5]
MSTPRQRYREQVRREIKQAALAQIGEGEPLSLTAVARRLGMTGPALYKYFAGRDRLLAELVDDGLAELAAAVRAGSPATGGPRARLHALARAFYDWAMANRGLFQLVAAAPRRAGVEEVLGPFLPVLGQGRAVPGLEPPEWAHAPAGDRAAALTGAVLVWARLQGVLSVELRGPFTGTGPALLTAEIDSLADTMGL